MKFSPRHLVWVNLVLLALVAYLAASTVSTAIAAKLTPPPEVHLKPPPPPISKVPRRPATFYASITNRDVFNPARPPEPVEARAEPAPTKLDLKLWGVSIHSQGHSLCVIEDLKTRKQDVYGIGSRVVGNATVKAIEWERVVLDRGGGLEETLEIERPGGGMGGGSRAVAGLPVIPQPAAVPPMDSNAGYAAPGVSPAATNPHIQQVGEGEYHIDRTEVDQQLDNMNQLFTQVRAVPHFESGKSIGFRLFAIRQGSIFDQIGLRNGDIIQNVNGQELSDPAQAMAVFQNLRNAGDITVNGTRNKQPFTQTYRIR